MKILTTTTVTIILLASFALTSPSQSLEHKASLTTDPGPAPEDKGIFHKYLHSEDFFINPDRSSLVLLIYETNMKQVYQTQANEYLEEMVAKYGTDIIQIVSKDGTPLPFKYSLRATSRFYGRGIIQIHLDLEKDFKDEVLVVKVRSDEYRKDKDKHKTTSSSSRLLLQHFAQQSNSGEYEVTIDLPAVWSGNMNLAKLFGFFGLFVRIIVLVLQFVLICLRPFIFPKESVSYFWSASLASTLFSLQLFLIQGAISENFGGVVDSGLMQMLGHSRRTFLQSIQPNFINTAEVWFQGAGFWNLAYADYLPSPFVENYISIVLLLIVCIGTTLTGQESPHYYFRELRFGFTVSFMVPHLVVSVHTIYAFFLNRLFMFSGLLSLILAFILIAYYTVFLFERQTGKRNKPYLLENYDHLKFDCIHFITTTDVDKLELWMTYSIALLLALGGAFSVFPLFIVGLVSVWYFIRMLSVTTKEPSQFDSNTNYGFYFTLHTIKKISYAFRPLGYLLMGAFSLVRTLNLGSTLGVKVFSLLFFAILVIDLIFQLVILGMRIGGFFQPKMLQFNVYLKVMANGNYVEMQDYNEAPPVQKQPQPKEREITWV